MKDEGMKQFTVTWTYDCRAESAEAAALLASAVMLTPCHGGNLDFEVEEHGSDTETVLLASDGAGNDLSLLDVGQTEEPQKTQYRILLRRLSSVPSDSVREEMERILPGDWRTEFYNFKAAPSEVGAMVRSILWVEGVTPQTVCEGSVIVRVQRQKPDTRDPLAKRLSSPIPEYEDIGSWDCGGIEYSMGR